MDGEAIAECQTRFGATFSFARSVLLLAAAIVALALILAAVAFSFELDGSAGPQGVALAAAICLGAGITAEAISLFFTRFGALTAMLAGMGLRLAPPLIVCLVLALMGESGRQHLAFVCYLLAFYVVTLILETILAVSRAHSTRNEG